MDVSLFDEECQELLARLEQALLDLADDATDVANVDEAFRQLHTIKGNAGLFSFDAVIDFTHLVENLMDAGRMGRVFDSTDIDLFLSCLDTIRALVDEALGRPGDPAALDRKGQLTERLRAQLGPTTGTGVSELEEADESTAATQKFDGVFLFDEASPEPAPAPEAATPRAPASSGRAGRRQTMRVPSQSLDRLMDLIGGLVTAAARTRLVAAQVETAELSEALDAQERLLDGLREATLGLRMVPIGSSFSTFKRLVREVSGDLGKEVRLELQGTETEIDKAVVEQVRDPLMHLVRNALDHGIETPAARVAAGKSPAAVLCLRAYQEFGTVVIEVRDDGAGIDCGRVLEKAQARGLAPLDMMPDDPGVPELILLPGFSTKDQVSDLSGRGVGMDVVATAIRALRGTLTIETTEGHGTCFRIRLPLTMAIISGFLIEVGNSAFVIPMDKVIECVSLPPDCVPTDGLTDLVGRRGEMVPYIRMDRLLGHASASGGRGDLVLVRHGAGAVGLLVDKLVGAHQTVVKPVGPVFRNQATFSGASLLGSGEVALILDTDAIIEASLPASGAA